MVMIGGIHCPATVSLFFLFGWLLLTDVVQGKHSKNRCICSLPNDIALCDYGFVETCKAITCYGSDALCGTFDGNENGFLNTCYVLEGLFQTTSLRCDIQNQKQNHHEKHNNSQRRNDCYNGQAIEITTPVRGGCEAGSCCQLLHKNDDNKSSMSPPHQRPLCDLERIFFFMSLGYGIATDHSLCSSSLDAITQSTTIDSLPEKEVADCSFVTNGKNHAVVCSNADITRWDDDNTVGNNNHSCCDISFSGTNNFLDLFKEALLVSHVKSKEVTIQQKEQLNSSDDMARMEVSFVLPDFMAEIAYGKDDDDDDDDDDAGIVNIAIKEAAAKGCFNNVPGTSGIHVMGHSLGAVMSNLFALKTAVLYPNVKVRITTAGEPAMFLQPLQGYASQISAWDHKVRYINGRVLPRNKRILPILLGAETDKDENTALHSSVDNGNNNYGIYQDYDPIAQSLPGGYHAGSGNSKEIFLCETMQSEGHGLLYYLGEKGCVANNRADIKNPLPNFPHKGGLEKKTTKKKADEDDNASGATAAALDEIKTFFQIISDLENDDGSEEVDSTSCWDDIIHTLNVATTITDREYRDAFYQVGDLHSLRRSLLFFNNLYRQGNECSATHRVIPLSSPCPTMDDDPFSSST